MIENQIFMTSEHFLTWWEEQNPTEAIDINEALQIYFNQETYDLGAI